MKGEVILDTLYELHLPPLSVKNLDEKQSQVHTVTSRKMAVGYNQEMIHQSQPNKGG
jgi:hypothetical protein